jgi:aspartyl/glutamyl-tRNA(Asn/Gln) amidotransferase C subunit
MSFTEQDLDTLSKLSRITLTEEEKPKMLLDIQAILGYISEINEVEGNLSRGEETLFNVVREDIVTRGTGSHTQELLREAPATKDGYVQVMQVLK